MSINDFFSPIIAELAEQQQLTPDKLSVTTLPVKGSHFPKFVVISTDSCLLDHFESLLRETIKAYINDSFAKETIENKEILRNKLEKKIKRYNALGNVVYSKNVAHKTIFRASTLDDAADAYRSVIYDYFPDNVLDDIINQFKDTVETNFPDWSSQIILYEKTGCAQLLTFFDEATQKTIHKNVGNFFFIHQKDGSLRLENPPVRKRRADNVFDKAVYLFDLDYLLALRDFPKKYLYVYAK